MKIDTLRFQAKDLAKIHYDHLGFLIASSHCCNELTCVMPYIIFEHDFENANEAERAFMELRFYTIVRFQIGKIFEYRDLCNIYMGKINKTYPAMAARLRKTSGEISRKIDSANWAKTLRNKVAFHFDAEYALGCLRETPQDLELTSMFGPYAGTTAFNFAEQIIGRAVFLEAGKGDYGKGQDVVKEWTLGLDRTIKKFHAEILMDLFKQYGLNRKQEELEFRAKFCAGVGEVSIPLSTRASTPS